MAHVEYWASLVSGFGCCCLRPWRAQKRPRDDDYFPDADTSLTAYHDVRTWTDAGVAPLGDQDVSTASDESFESASSQPTSPVEPPCVVSCAAGACVGEDDSPFVAHPLSCPLACIHFPLTPAPSAKYTEAFP